MKKPPAEDQNAPAMPFNEALKRVWSAKPMHKVKPKPSSAKKAAKEETAR